jgi:hypothetical protein
MAMGAQWRLGTRGLVLAAVASALACGTDAAGVDACKQVEAARCKAAGACGVPLEPPHAASGSNADECIRFYDVACLHGLAIGSDPGISAVNACVSAIGDHPCNAGGANLVVSPEKDPACAWLVPPPAPATDAGSEASSDASYD